MKKVIAAAVLAGLMPLSQAMADQDIGCGLGSMVFAGKEGKVFKVLGATTNGTSGNQTFGITFGTLGCEGDGVISSKEKLAMFIDGNMDNLARDIARGEGETLATLTDVWGMSDEAKAEFNTQARNNYAAIFASENVTSADVLANLNTMVADQNTLAAYAL
ncbi:DUF3015 domain-containing protein [Photobacterium sp. CCB-ST2H9]|uniref:DUF3015 family protein n=1 Tax=unclassified Photobacterium TaxID=2628852 RepID=UPI002004A8AC|nr:DUF3015 family protein [Photobacterium sp. CCB-ST2H9]UTM60093.1 DUF3015 domain-containing protein [Photobacterium sp. CCB-ST2H9]